MVGDKKVDVRTDENGDYKGTIELKKYFSKLMQVKAVFDETAKCQELMLYLVKGINLKSRRKNFPERRSR